MLTKKHYKAIADIIRKNLQGTENEEYINELSFMADLCIYFLEDNPQFNAKKFADYVYRVEKQDAPSKMS